MSKPFSDHLVQISVSSEDENSNDQFREELKEIGELIRKKQGGKGRSRLSRSSKVKTILTALHDETQMSSKVAYHPGHYMGEIIRFFPSPNWKSVPKLVEGLCDSMVVTYREGRGDERGKKYYYRTEKAKETLEDIEKMKDIRKRQPF